MKHALLLFLGIFCLTITFSKESIEEMEKRLPTAAGEERVQLLIDLSFEYKFKSAKKALILAKEALRFANEYPDQSLLSSAHNRLGNTYRIVKKPDSALIHTLTALNIAKQLHNLPLESLYLNSIGLVYMDIEDYDEALSYFTQSIEIRQKLGEEYEDALAKTMHNVGSIHYHIKQYEESESYYRNALTLKRKVSKLNLRSQALTLDKLGLAYMKLGKFDEAGLAFKEALAIRQNIKFRFGEITSLIHLGELYIEQGRNLQALSLLQQGIQTIGEDQDFHLYKSQIWYYMGKVYHIQGNLAAAETYFTKSVDLINVISDHQINYEPNLLREVHHALARTYAEQGEYQNAWKSMETFAILSDSSVQDRMAKEIAQAQVAYENAQATAQKDEKIRQMNEQAKTNRDFLIATLMCLLLLLALIFAIYLRFRSRQKLMQRLSEQNILLKRSNDDLERFAYIASHDLKEPLRTISSFVQLIDRKYSNKLDKDGQEYISFVVTGVNRIYQLLDDLLAYSRVNHQGKEKAEAVDIQKVLDQVLANLDAQIKQHNIEIFLPTSVPKITYHEVFLVQIFQNLMHNSIKFRKEESPFVKVHYTQKAHEHLFIVEDNGIGIAQKYQYKVFTIFQRLHHQEEIEGTGIGLAICKKIIERSKGKIWIDSELDKGTKVYFTIPEI